MTPEELEAIKTRRRRWIVTGLDTHRLLTEDMPALIAALEAAEAECVKANEDSMWNSIRYSDADDKIHDLTARLQEAEADAASWMKIASHEPGHCKKCEAMAAYDARVRKEAQP